MTRQKEKMREISKTGNMKRKIKGRKENERRLVKGLREERKDERKN